MMLLLKTYFYVILIKIECYWILYRDRGISLLSEETESMFEGNARKNNEEQWTAYRLQRDAAAARKRRQGSGNR